MKLGRKNLVYSLLLAGIMLLFLVGYFICMLPSLYVDYVREQNLAAIKAQHRAYMEKGSYEGVRVNNLTASFSIKIPDEGDRIFVTGKPFSVEVELKDEHLKEQFAEIRRKLQGLDHSDIDDMDHMFAQWNQVDAGSNNWEKQLLNLLEDHEDFPVDIHFLYMADINSEYKNESLKVHNLSNQGLILEAGIEDSENKYTNYIAIETTDDAMIFSFLPTMTPEMNEITPVVLQSLPMLSMVILLLVLLFSQIYSRGIVTPIVRLAAHTEQMKNEVSAAYSIKRIQKVKETRDGKEKQKEREARDGKEKQKEREARDGKEKQKEREASDGKIKQKEREMNGGKEKQKDAKKIGCKTADITGIVSQKEKNRRDEIGELAAIMDDLYVRIQESYRSLEEKNEELQEENKRQEVFLRASSHQLKTPISAALLLVDGMTNEIGKYKDRDLYLPQVKKQLLSMRTIVEDILYLNHCGDNLNFQNIEMRAVIEERLAAYQLSLTEQDITVVWEGQERLWVVTDGSLVLQIVDNLLSNAVKYSPAGATIRIRLSEDAAGACACIENEGVTIPEELLPHIFDAFVSGNHGTESHGLGLYIASYYAKKIGAELSIENMENRVAAKLIFTN